MRKHMSGQSSGEALIFIMRHGEAESLRIDDQSRQLTPFGRQQAIATAQWIKQNYCSSGKIDYCMVSPYRRTRQTYDMVSLDLRSAKTEISEDVIPEGHAASVSDYLDALLQTYQGRNAPIKTLLVVSHMPLVSFLVDNLCHNAAGSLFATGSVAVIRYNLAQHQGELLTHFQGD